jgi:hypothetical protein
MRSSAVAATLVGSLLVAGQGISATELKELRENGSIRIAVYRDFFPFSDQMGGRIQGIDLKVGQAVAEKLGLAVDVMELTADESVSDDLRNAVWKGHYLGGGTADVMMHVPVDHSLAEENNQVRILAPYYREELAIAYDPLGEGSGAVSTTTPARGPRPRPWGGARSPASWAHGASSRRAWASRQSTSPLRRSRSRCAARSCPVGM